VLGGLLGWAKSDEVTALFLELEKYFGDVPGVSVTGLEPLRNDPEFLQLLLVFWRTAEFPRDEMVAVIERHVGATEDMTGHELAEALAEAMDRYSARARSEHRELFAIEVLRQSLSRELDALRAELRSAPVTRHVTVEWTPPFARERLRRMLADHAEDLALLEEALGGLDDPRNTIRGLIADPPEWLVKRGFIIWDALGEVAGGYGLWESASAAFERAGDLPGADRPPLLARAAANALLAEDEERYETLLGRATALDPGHAQVVLAQLRPGMTAEERLEILDAAPEQPDPRRASALNVSRALARMDLQQWDEAERLIADVRTQLPEHVALRELGAALAVGRARMAAASGANVDTRALRQASDEALALRNDLLASFRFNEAGRLLARAIVALALAGERDQGAVLLESVREEETTSTEARLELYEAALSVGRPDVVRALARPDESEEERLFHAQAIALQGNQAEIRSAIETLDRLLDSPVDGIRSQAAVARQIACLGGDVDWNNKAQRIVEAKEPVLAAILLATKLRREGRVDEADALLLGRQDDVRILRELIRSAGQENDWDRVLGLSRALVAKGPTPLDRLVFVDALYRSNERDEALVELVSLQHDESVPHDGRAEAFAYAAQIAMDAFDFEAVQRICAEWFEFDPNDKRASWGFIHALLRLGRGREALKFALETGLEPNVEREAELLAAVFDEDDDAAAVARRIRALSDRFERPERLEAHFLVAALRVHPAERIEDLREEIQARLASFAERFPDSQLIVSVPIDPTPEGIDAFFREYIEPGADTIRTVADQLRNGSAPVALLAAVSGRPVAVATVQLERILPLGFGDELLSNLEREDAETAVGRPVVWDPTSLGVVALLQREASEAIRLAFPGAVAAQATIDDIRRAGDSIAMERDEYSVIGFDAGTGHRFIRERSPEEVRREREAIRRAVEISQTLRVEPDVDPGKPTEIDAFLLGENERNLSFMTWPATLAVAQRSRYSLYSDDRFVRVQARRAGLATFGTIAVLDVLVRRGMMTDEQRRNARAALRRSGANGIGGTLEEILEEGRETHWALTEGLAFALLDPTAWAGPIAVKTFRTWAEVLRTVFAEEPERFENWVLRFMDAAKANLPGERSYGFVAQSLLLIAWEPLNPEGRPFVHALIKVLRDAPTSFGWFRDPVIAVAQQLQAVDAGAGTPEVRGILWRRFLQDVPFEYQLRLLGIRL